MNLNQSQQKAIYEVNKHLYVTASAGTGKTEVLTQRYIHILEHKKVNVSQILSITFTEKAAKEMKSRIIKFILAKAKTTTGKEQHYWRKVKKDFRYANISTIHSFCAKIIRDFAIELGIDPDFTIIEEPELKHELHKFIKYTLSKWINDDVKASNIKPLLMEYGFSKLKNILTNLFFSHFDIEHKIIPLYEKYNTKKDYINYLKTFIENEKNNRLKQVLKLKSIEKLYNYICSIELLDHSNVPFSKYLRNIKEIVNYHLNGSIHPNFNDLYKDREFKETDKKHWTESEFNDFFIQLEALRYWLPQTLFDNKDSELQDYDLIKRIISLYKDLVIRAKDYGNNIVLFNWLNHSLLTYNDLQHLAFKLLSYKAYDDLVRYGIKSKYKYIMVDESQDIDKIQKDIISNMVNLNDSYPNLFIVGDSKQSIYKFRGADISVFHNLINGISLRNNSLYSLDINYRSQSRLINFTNILFSRLMGETFDDFEVNYPSFISGCRKDELSYNIELMLHHEDREKEANQIAKKILSIVNGNELSKKVNYGDIAILFQAFTHISIYEKALLSYGIPYTLLSVRGFYKLQEIVDCINLLRVVDNIQDSIYLCGVLRSPFCGISDSGLFWLTSYKDNPISLLKGFFDIENNEHINSKDKEKLIFFRSLLKDIISKKDKFNISELLKLAISNTGYIAILLSHNNGEQKKHNIDYFIYKIRHLEQSGLLSIRELLDYIETLDNFDHQEPVSLSNPSSNCVNVMTIHKAKGMEFPIVILANIDNKNTYNDSSGLLVNPDLGIGLKLYSDKKKKLVGSYLYTYLRDLETRKEIAESKRLFYVAITRARDYLILSGKVSLSRNNKLSIKSIYSSGNSWLNYFTYIFTKEDEKLKEAMISKQDYDFKIPKSNDILFKVTWDIKGHFKPVDNTNNRHLGFDVLKSSILINTVYTPSLRTLSPTAIVVYEKCQRRFYYKFICQILESQDSIGPYKLDDNNDFNLSTNIPMNLIGNVVHKVLETFTINHNLRNIVLSYLGDQKLSSLSKEQDRQKLTDYIKIIVEKFIESDLYKSIKKSEADFPLDQYNEFQFMYKFGDIYLQGAIDKVYFDKDKGFTLLDYKTNNITSKKQLDIKTAEHNLQLKLYYVAISELITKVDRTILYFLDINKGIDPISSSNLVIDSVKSELEALLNDLKSKLKSPTSINLFKTQPSRIDCYFCGYWMCENKG